jgi:hypothetical protein
MKRSRSCHSDPAVAGEEALIRRRRQRGDARDVSILRIKLRPGKRFAEHDRYAGDAAADRIAR